jgi:hypothetical protein
MLEERQACFSEHLHLGTVRFMLVGCAPGEGLSLTPGVHRTSLFPTSCSFEFPFICLLPKCAEFATIFLNYTIDRQGALWGLRLNSQINDLSSEICYRFSSTPDYVAASHHMKP